MKKHLKNSRFGFIFYSFLIKDSQRYSKDSKKFEKKSVAYQNQ
jgi:hypothetical protein